MLTNNQQLWVDALRSGDYQQAKSTLQNEDGYCCLGVACKVAQENGVNVHLNEFGKLIGDDLNSQATVQEWLGLKSACGYFSNGVGDRLVGMNDSGFFSFKQIADEIENESQSLFIQGDEDAN